MVRRVDGSSPSEGSERAPHVGAFHSGKLPPRNVRWVWSRLLELSHRRGEARRRLESPSSAVSTPPSRRRASSAADRLVWSVESNRSTVRFAACKRLPSETCCDDGSMQTGSAGGSSANVEHRRTSECRPERYGHASLPNDEAMSSGLVVNVPLRASR